MNARNWLNKFPILRLFAAFLITANLAACTRSSSDVSTVRLSIPATRQIESKVAKQAEGTLSHLIINVSSGLNPGQYVKTFEWSRRSSTGTQTTPPSFEVDVARAEPFLFQVLGVYETSAGSMAFYYDDETKSFTSEADSVDIVLQLIGSGSIVAGQVTGRYLTSADMGPTGPVFVKYYPPNKLPLLLDRSFIWAGWFNFFILDGNENTRFGYELPDGRLLWGRPVNLSDAEFAPSATVLRAAVPVNLRAEYGENNSSTWVANEPLAAAYGWFAAPQTSGLTAGKHVCAPSSLTSLSRVSPYTATPSASPPPMPGTILSSQNLPTAAELTALPNTLNEYRIKGGVTQTCSTLAVDITNHLDTRQISSMLNGEGKDGLQVHFPPLKAQQDTNNRRRPVSISPVTGITDSYRIEGQFLPGVSPTLIDQIVVFKRVANERWDWHNDRIPCNEMMNGFENFTRVITQPRTAEGFQIDLNITPTEVSTGTTLALCYARGTQMLDAGLLIPAWSFTSFGSTAPDGGSGSPPTPYLRVEIHSGHMMGRANSVLTANYCHSAELVLYQSGTNYTNTTTSPIIVSGLPSTGNLRFYSTSNCAASSEISSVNIGVGQSRSAAVYLKGTVPVTNFTLNPSLSDTSIQFHAAANMLDVENPNLQLEGPLRAVASACYPYRVSTHLSSGGSFEPGSLNVTLAVGTVGTFYDTKGACDTNSNPGSGLITGNQSQIMVWAKSASPGSVTITATAAGFSPVSYVANMAASGSQKGLYLRLDPVTPPILVSKCNKMRLSLVNENGDEVVSNAEIPLNLAMSNRVGAYYTDPWCSMTDPTFSISPISSGRIVFYRPFTDLAPALAGLPAALPLYPGNPSLTAQLPSTGPYIKFSAPVFGGNVIGSHEFGNPSWSFTTPAGTQTHCMIDTGSGQTPCSADEFSNGVFTWRIARAISNTRFRFFNQSTSNMENFAEIEFWPDKVYGPDFTVVDCASTVTANTSGSLAVAMTSPVCVASGVQISCSAETSLPSGFKLIGHTSRPQVVSSIGSGSCFSSSNDPIPPQSTTMLANLSFQINSSTSSVVNAIRVAGNSPTNPASSFRGDNLAFNLSATSVAKAYGYSIENNGQNFKVAIDNNSFTLDSQNTGYATGVAIANDNASQTWIRHSTFTTSGTTNTQQTGILIKRISGSNAGPVMIDMTLLDGPNLLPITTIGSIGMMNSLHVTNSRLTSTVSGFGMKLFPSSNSVGHHFANNLMSFVGGSSTDSLFDFDLAGTNFYARMRQNKFKHAGVGHLFTLQSNTAAPYGELELTANSFLSTSTGGGQVNYIYYDYDGPSGDQVNIHSSVDTSDGGNRVCNTSVSHGWSTPPTYADGGGSTITLPTPANGVTAVADACP